MRRNAYNSASEDLAYWPTRRRPRDPESLAGLYCGGSSSAQRLHCGFHVRGACVSPAWHSIRAAWEGEYALHRLFPDVLESDIPLAEDCFGDQYLLRESLVLRLFAETGEIEKIKYDWPEFLVSVEADPIGCLNLGLLERFREEIGPLAPGSRISVYPPFVSEECRNPSLKAISALELRVWHADFARQIKNIPDGQKVKLTVL